MPEIITSVQNPRIKNIVLLQSKSRERKQQNRIVIEGYREISRALASGIVVKELYYCPEFDAENRAGEILHHAGQVVLFEISRNVFEKIAYREGSDGVIALAEPWHLSPEDIKMKENLLLIILESVEKPGNLGAVMRTADAAGVDAVIVCDPLSDIYNPNVIRSSVGCVFTVPVIAGTTEEIQRWLAKNRIKSYAAALTEEAIPYDTADYSGPAAIVLGTEATGLSRSWLTFSDRQIIIPMHGIADSLNVSTSAAIITFEAVRQRKM